MPVKTLITLACILFINAALAQVTYPGNKLPTDIPSLFAEGILTDGLSNRDFTISPKGDELFCTLQQSGFTVSTILHMVKKDGRWGKIEVAPFSGKYKDLEASFSADGQTIYFSSNRPLAAGRAKKDFDIWMVKKLVNGKWGDPEHLGNKVNSEKNEYYPSIAKNGDLYFTVEAAYGKGKEDIVMCKLVDGVYSTPESLPATINSPKYEFNAFVDPDEQFILFTSFGRDDDLGGGDLYISRKDKDGNWMQAKHLPAPINTTALDYCPFISWDKKIMVFASNRTAKEVSDGQLKTYEQLKWLLTHPGNGHDDIYWVKFDPDW